MCNLYTVLSEVTYNPQLLVISLDICRPTPRAYTAAGLRIRLELTLILIVTKVKTELTSLGKRPDKKTLNLNYLNIKVNFFVILVIY